MINEINLIEKYYYHNLVSLFMIIIIIALGYYGYKIKNKKYIKNVSIVIIVINLVQEIIDYINRIFLDENYFFSMQQDIPFLQFCHISFYFSL